jgi:predicted ester cyclase
MTDIEAIAASFHHACMTGAGWEACRQHCTPDATFEHEGETFADVRTLEAYAAFVQCLYAAVPDFGHDVLAVAVDHALGRALVHYRIRGTRAGGGPAVPPTGKAMASDCVLILHFEGERIHHAQKVWNDRQMMKQVGRV